MGEGNAVLLERGAGFSRIVGTGYHRLRPYERVRGVIDLRTHYRKGSQERSDQRRHPGQDGRRSDVSRNRAELAGRSAAYAAAAAGTVQPAAPAPGAARAARFTGNQPAPSLLARNGAPPGV